MLNPYTVSKQIELVEMEWAAARAQNALLRAALTRIADAPVTGIRSPQHIVVMEIARDALLLADKPPTTQTA